jgi:hypothetical protein
MRQYAPGVGAGIFLERAVTRKATGACATGWQHMLLARLLLPLPLVVLLSALTDGCCLADQWPSAAALPPAELTERAMQDLAAQQDTIPAGLSQPASVA